MFDQCVQFENSAIAPEIASYLLGETAPMVALKETLSLLAPTDAPVLATGQTGAGKEMVAQAVHAASGRSGSFVAVNCAAIPAELLESELFGHEKGAFTGAENRRIGRIEAAAGGTLFLDEIGDMPDGLQAKLLRVLETRRITRLGGSHDIEVDFRLVTATHRDLEVAVKEGKFRADLFYRINVFPVQVPPLAQRVGDIPLLLEHMIETRTARAPRGGAPHFTDAALAALARHDWPGNVRELRNTVERAMVLFAGRDIGAADIERLLGVSPLASAVEGAGDAEAPVCILKPGESINLRRHLQELEATLIQAALAQADGRVAQAARQLGLQRTTLIEKMKKLGLSAARAKAA
ncbi:Fis family sigma54 specific transcriptional regulator [Rhodovulum bhavnagarense]|uniref:Nif-specific regulatory protein n=1 Tax=Rhodovulum bhavnagarense TaxID=992286 RepID=A0A4R2RCN7_9RHOB|nr:sigma-54 dependent transcriptional regulator [Rhodovulum bhavnagarense]TCP60573.1 Fis family sigma54 specific transcriptional regulator [Rhodovulum bhavnagarense]